jgi:hypothetical protein
MAILYTIMFAVMRGWFIVENGVWYWYKNYLPTYGARQPVEETQVEKDSKAMANLLLLYPLIYFICIFPQTVARQLYFDGHNVKYQGTCFANTLFCLSGTFNTILFFFTRPDLVVGSADSPSPAPPVDIPNQAVHDGELTTQTPRSRKFGCLPSRSPISSDYIPSNPEADYNGKFDPFNSIPLDETANSNIHALPRRMESDSDSNATHLSGERTCGDFKWKRVLAAPVEEESYGHLPA